MFTEAFSIQNSIKAVFAPASQELFPSLHSFRFLGTVWILTIHTFFFALSALNSSNLSLNGEPINSISKASFYVVDIFFPLSGFLHAYNFCEEQKKRSDINIVTQTVKRIVKRYLRINIPFLIVSIYRYFTNSVEHLEYEYHSCFLKAMVFGTVLGIYLNDTSEFQMLENMEGNCKKNWWRNLMLIQNYYEPSKTCSAWSWFVAADFQLFIVFSILLAVAVKYGDDNTVSQIDLK